MSNMENLDNKLSEAERQSVVYETAMASIAAKNRAAPPADMRLWQLPWATVKAHRTVSSCRRWHMGRSCFAFCSRCSPQAC